MRTTPGNCRFLQLMRPAASVGSRESPATLPESTALKISRLGLAEGLTTGRLCNVAERKKSAGTLRRRAGRKSVRFGVYNRPYVRVRIWRSPASPVPGSNDSARRSSERGYMTDRRSSSATVTEIAKVRRNYGPYFGTNGAQTFLDQGQIQAGQELPQRIMLAEACLGVTSSCRFWSNPATSSSSSVSGIWRIN